MYKKYHPPHIYVSDSIYFLTAHTIDQRKLFDTDEKKQLLNDILFITTEKYETEIHTWIILSDHYHLLIKSSNKLNIPKFIKSFHGKSAIELNKLDHTSGRKVWVNYWDYCIRSEKDYWIHFNYIHNNPIKHGYIKDIDQLRSYIFSGYNSWVEKLGPDGIMSIWRQYPVIDFTAKGDIP